MDLFNKYQFPVFCNYVTLWNDDWIMHLIFIVKSCWYLTFNVAESYLILSDWFLTAMENPWHVVKSRGSLRVPLCWNPAIRSATRCNGDKCFCMCQSIYCLVLDSLRCKYVSGFLGHDIQTEAPTPLCQIYFHRGFFLTELAMIFIVCN